MTIFVVDNDFDPRIFKGASVAFGVFDGVHLGHQYLIGQTVSTANEDDALAIALTFDRDPDEVFCPNDTQKLMSNQERLEALAASGVNHVVVLPFTPDFYTLEPEAFLTRTFGLHAPAHMHVGSDFHFGARAAGDADMLRSWGETTATRIHAHDLFNEHGCAVTATRIRGLLAQGNVKEAAALLGHPYTVCGTVVKGRGEGKSLGFATANMSVPANELVIANGVYAGYARIISESGEGTCSPESLDSCNPKNPKSENESPKIYKTAVSVGVSPTFEEEGASANVEAHLLDFSGDITGKRLCIEFVERLAPLQKFDSPEELSECVAGYINWVSDKL